MEPEKPTNSEKPLTAFQRAQIERLARRFTHLVWDEITGKEYKRVLANMVSYRGEQDTETAITKAIDTLEFLSPEKLRECFPPPPLQQNRCRRCRDNEGWIYVLVDGERVPRALKCKHGPMTPTVQVVIGTDDNKRQVTAICCDYVDAQRS